MTYINITETTKNIPGMDIQAAMFGNFIRVIRGSGKEVIPCNQITINPHAIYDITDNGHAIIITKANGWCCTKEQYDEIMSEGNRILNDIFGDIFAKIDTIGK